MILVTGATGNVGGQVLAQLADAGQQVRAVSRAPARGNVPAGVEVIWGDLLDPATFWPMLDGVDRMFVYPVPETAAAFAAKAREAGVTQAVVLSSLGSAGTAIGERHRAVEQAVESTGMAWTHVRPGAFAANARQWAPSIRAESVVRSPFGTAATAPVHEADIAAVAVAALTGDGHAGRAYEVSGPESLTFRQQAEIIGQVIGRDIRFVELSEDEARAQMTRYAPEGVVDALLAMWASLAGTTAPVLPAVEDVTGRPPRSFAQWVADHAGTFR